MSNKQNKKLIEIDPEAENYVDSDADDSNFVTKHEEKLTPKKCTSRVKPCYDPKNKVMYE